MKKCKWMLLVVLGMALCCLPLAAGAEVKTVSLDHDFILEPGKTYHPDYPDYSGRFGEQYTKDDFTITYASKVEGVSVAADGALTVSEDVQVPSKGYIKVTYKRKNSSTKKTFDFVVAVTSPLIRVELNLDTVYVPITSEGEAFSFSLVGSKLESVMDTLTYDDAVAEVTRRHMYSSSKYGLLITPKAPGETMVTLRSYNNIIKTFRVVVIDEVRQLTLAADRFTCLVGETIDLGVDLGVGPEGLTAYQPSFSVYRNGAFGAYQNYVNRAGQFCADETGEYQVSFSCKGYSASATVYVYDPADCAKITLSGGEDVLLGSQAEVFLYDAQGNRISRPLSVTEGAENVTLQYGVITAQKVGSFTLTAENEDGSTISRTFQVKEKAASLTLAATEIVLEIGETFDLAPVVDGGSFACVYENSYQGANPPYGLKCFRMEGRTIVAQAAGSGSVKVSSGGLYAYCQVTVNDSDLALNMVFPEEPIGVGETCQVTIQDRTGKVYPAVFDQGYYSHQVSVTADGQVTGLRAGNYQVRATTEDGRALTSDYHRIVIKPKWIRHDDVVVTTADSSLPLGTVGSDAGDLGWGDVLVTVADESVVTYSGGRFTIQGAGKTMVELRANYGGGSASFLIEVLPESPLYVGSASINVPYGFVSPLPVVVDAEGNEVSIVWEITHNTPGEGNPDSSGFLLEEGGIACTWPTASCVVTGTAKNGATVKVTAKGYLLPENIRLTASELTLQKGRSATLKVESDDPDAKILQVFWLSETQGIISHAEYTANPSVTVTGLQAGTTRIAAVLDNGAAAICTVTVYDPNARLPGDVNDDGKVDVHDALRIMQYCAGWSVSVNGYAGDVDADGDVDLNDALLILQHTSGLNVQLKQYIPAP